MVIMYPGSFCNKPACHAGVAIHVIHVSCEQCLIDDCLAEAVLLWFRQLQWDGAISQAMLQSIGTVLERCSDDVALGFIKSLTEPPSLISPLQVCPSCSTITNQGQHVSLWGEM